MEVSFWFGLLVFAFLGWAAWKSYQIRTGAVLYTPGSFYAVHAFHAKFYLVTGTSHAGSYSLEFMEPESLDAGGWKARLALIHRDGSRVPRIAFGVVAAPFFLGWVAFLGWRWRRQNKAKEMS